MFTRQLRLTTTLKCWAATSLASCSTRLAIAPALLSATASGEIVRERPPPLRLVIVHARVPAPIGSVRPCLAVGANTRTHLGKTKELGGYAPVAVALEAQLGRIPASLGFVEAG